MSTITLHEVAKAAGVSKATVSRVLNNSSRVAPELAQTVRHAITRMNYQPSVRRRGPRAVSRQGISTGNVLFLLLGVELSSGFRFTSYPTIIEGIEGGIRHNGLKLFMANVESNSAMSAAIDPKAVDGVLLFGDPKLFTPAISDKLRDVPIVGLMRGMEPLRGRIDRVSFDNAAVGPMAAEYLLARGHQHLAFYSTDPHHGAFIPRHKDFVAAAASKGVEVVSLIGEQRPREFRQELFAAETLIQRLLDAPRRATGMFVAADFILPPLYHALERRGIRPGVDIDIVSCDNDRVFLDQLTPRPATININLKLVGRKGVEQLLWRMAHPEIRNTIHCVIEPVLVPGDGPIPFTHLTTGHQ